MSVSSVSQESQDSQKLLSKIEAIQPSGPSTVLKPGVAFVAVLKPHKNIHDDIGPSDVFWAKCPLTKPVSTITKAFGRQVPNPVLLFQGDNTLKEDQLLSSLSMSTERLCTIRAVYLDDVDSYRPKHPVDHKLRDDFDDPAKRVSESQPPLAKPDISPSPSHQAIGIKRAASVEHPPRKITPAFGTTVSSPSRPELRDVSEVRTPLGQAWIDFVYDQRQLMRYLTTSAGEVFVESPINDLSITQEWGNLRPNQKLYFVDRSKNHKFPNLTDRRAFWIWYYESSARSQAAGINSHATFETTHAFFEETYSAWNNLSSSLRATYHRIVNTQGYNIGIPPLPSESLPPSLQVGTIAASRDSARNNYDTTPGSANHHAAAQSARDPSMASSYDEVRGTPSPQQSVQPPLVDDTLPERLNVNELFEGRSAEQLEQGVAKGVEILRSIKIKLESEPSQESEHWLTAIKNIEKQVVRTKTIVGVVGATGAGKSSVINAMLDEERLVPTNCMRACTAVVTEISYNYEEVQYRAEIDFISREDWLKELKISFQDLFDGNGKVSRDSTNEDSEAGIAYAKIKAVYPLLSKENMETTTIEKLMEHNNVRSLLGGSRTIEDEDPASFYKLLQRYVDSKEKVFSREKKTEAEKLKAKQMEYWPLIRVVRLYVKAPALATGAVIVDLPGVHDSNQARAAVAQGYLKQCTGLWIVAPINRAVDDKSAKTLLGDTFKRQLKMDGGYNSVTFICSKTDDISITEAQDSLGLDDEMSPLYARSEELRRTTKSLANELEDLKTKKSDMTAVLDAADEQLEVWEKLGADLEDGKTVYAPKVRKFEEDRKSSEEDAKPRKRPNYAENSDDESFINDEDDDLDDTYDDKDDEGDKSDTDEDRGEPLTADFVTDKVAELKDTKKQGRRERSTLEESIKELRRQINEISKEQAEIDAELMGKCIRGRNEYSRGAIQQDFASGIRELDQEIAEEEDAANFNPQVDVRDYDAVAKSLPVFCVSSRGYQKLMGRLKKDKALLTFRNVDETGIPSLQAHCKKLTETNREVASKRFLNNLSQFLNSLRLWSSSDGTAANLTDEQHKREAELLDVKLRKLDTALENAVAKICSGLSDGLQEYLYDKFPLAINAGKIEANDIQASWGAPINRENRAQGGLYWSTYKATVRRDGLWSNNDFNNDLIRPVLQHVTPGWEKVFSRCLPQTLSGFASEVHTLMTAFHTDVEKRAIVHGSSLATFHMLKQQLPAYREIAKDAANSAKEFINAKQKEINRDFVPTVSAAMLPVYVITTAEVGAGQYKRMKEAMQRHVEQCKHHMFDDSLNHVQELLKAMLKEAGEVMLTKLDDIFMAVKRDYVSVVVGKSRNSMQGQVLPKQQRKIRAEVLDVIDSVELAMKRVIGLEPPEEDIEQQEERDAMINMDEHERSVPDQDEPSGRDLTEHQNTQNEQRDLAERNENNTPSLVADDSIPRFNETNDTTGTINVSFDVIGAPMDKIARTVSSEVDKENTVPTQHTPAPEYEESDLFKIPEGSYDQQDLDMFNDTDWVVYTRRGGP